MNHAERSSHERGAVHAFVPSRPASHSPFEPAPSRTDIDTSSNAPHTSLDFTQLVADMATRFSALDPLAVDDAVGESLQQTANWLQLDWIVLCWKQPGETAALPTHQWIRPSCVDTTMPDAIASMTTVGCDGPEGADTWCFERVDDVPEADREAFRQNGLRSAVIVRLPWNAEGSCTLACGSSTKELHWPAVTVERVRLLAGIVGQSLAGKARHAALQKAMDEVGRLRGRLGSESDPRREVRVLRTPSTIVSESTVMREMLAQIEQVAPTPATVLLLGETGSGKEVLAQAIHDMSPRRQRPMIRVNCAAIPTTLIESELFGRERGAYTGALSRQIGRFEAAHQSTLFLDEIGDLSPDVQIKLLRVLQERAIERLGSTQQIKVDVRIIAATNRSLDDAVRAKTFREDLFYRLNVFPVTVPPLRDRVEDIPALVWSFVDEFSRSFSKPIDVIPKECIRQLQRYEWPGNVRELRNIVERAMILATGRQLMVWPPRAEQRPTPQADMSLCALESEHIRAVLEKTNWRVRGAFGAAERLGLKPTTLESRMARLGITRQKPR